MACRTIRRSGTMGCRVIQKVINDYKEHFIEDGWDINYDAILCDVIEEALGVGAITKLHEGFEKLGISVLVDTGIDIRKRRNRQLVWQSVMGYAEPVFYNPKSNILKVGYKKQSKHDVFIGGL